MFNLEIKDSLLVSIRTKLVTNHVITEFAFNVFAEISDESIFVYIPDIIIHYQNGIQSHKIRQTQIYCYYFPT